MSGHYVPQRDWLASVRSTFRFARYPGSENAYGIELFQCPWPFPPEDAIKEPHQWFGGKLLAKLKDGKTELHVARERAAEVKLKLGL